MAGGGGGGNVGGGMRGIGGSGGGLGGNPKITCDALLVNTILNSPNPTVISRLRVNDILIIELRNNSLLAITDNGEVAGSIASSMMAKIIECIERGFEYVAVVKKIDGGHCSIQIKSANK